MFANIQKKINNRLKLVYLLFTELKFQNKEPTVSGSLGTLLVVVGIESVTPSKNKLPTVSFLPTSTEKP